jgi:hypothetical protein
MKFKNFPTGLLLKGLFISALLLGANYYLSVKSDSNSKNSLFSAPSNCRTPIIAVNPDAKSGDEKSKDVNSKNAPINHTTVWLIAADFVNSTGKNVKLKQYQSNESANLYSIYSHPPKANSVLTVSQVDTELGRLGTLLGEKPSGTS